jgi:hypothetical protein
MKIEIELPDTEFCDECHLRLDNRCAYFGLSLERTRKDAWKVGARATEYHWIKNSKCPSLHNI